MIERSDGIFNQMQMEFHETSKNNMQWDTAIFCNEVAKNTEGFIINPKNIYSKTNGKWSFLNQIKFAIDYTRWLKEQESKYDFILLRYRIYSLPQLFFILTKKKKVFLVHHALELEELATVSSINFKLKTLLEFIIGKLSIKLSDGIIGVTGEIIDYEKNRARAYKKTSIIMPNGFVYNASYLSDKRGSIPEFIFTASFFSPWHGLDRLISCVLNSNDDFILHIVGNVTEIDLKSAQNDKRIIFHGKKSQSEIKDISERCWIGLASFALDRQNMTEACTLKVREYLAFGLPVFSGHKDVFPASFSYYQHSEEKITMSAIIKFARSHRDINRRETSEAARPYIEKSIILKNTYNAIKTQSTMN